MYVCVCLSLIKFACSSVKFAFITYSGFDHVTTYIDITCITQAISKFILKVKVQSYYLCK